jgi:hypothetical protein
MADTLDRRLLSIGHLTGSENALHFSVSSPFVRWTPVISSLAQSAQLTATCCCEPPMIDDSWDVLHFVFPSSPLSGTSSYNLSPLSLSMLWPPSNRLVVSQTLNASSFHFGSVTKHGPDIWWSSNMGRSAATFRSC